MNMLSILPLYQSERRFHFHFLFIQLKIRMMGKFIFFFFLNLEGVFNILMFGFYLWEY